MTPGLEGNTVDSCSVLGTGSTLQANRQRWVRRDNHTCNLVPRDRFRLVGKLHHTQTEDVQRPLLLVFLEISNLFSEGQVSVSSCGASKSIQDEWMVRLDSASGDPGGGVNTKVVTGVMIVSSHGNHQSGNGQEQ
jgi:hypothetical protein